MSERKDSRLGGGDARGRQRETVAVPPRQRGAGARGAQRQTVKVTPRPSTSPPRLRGVLTAGAVTAGWNALVVFIPILVAVITAWWAVGRPGGVSTVLRAAAAVWLYGHGAPVTISRVDSAGHTAELTFGLIPLLLTLVIFWRLSKAGGHTVRAIKGRDLPAVRVSVLAATISYVLIVLVAGFLASAPPFEVSTWRAGLHAAALCLVATSLGALAESGRGRALWRRLPVWLRRGVRTGGLTTASMLAVGALLAGAAFALRGSAVARTLPDNVDGALAVGVLTLLFIPTAAVWGAAYTLGPGFSVGAGTEVTVMDVSLGPMPVFPMFAAIPGEPLSWQGTVLWGVPLAIGVIQGVLLAVRSVDLRLPRLLSSTVAAAIVAGVLTGAAAFAASGPVGDARMSVVGPPVWETASVTVAVVGISVMLGALCARVTGSRQAR
ncbi:MAG: cell division protein PerM [Stackebrandtia sp.]